MMYNSETRILFKFDKVEDLNSWIFAFEQTSVTVFQ